MGVPCSELPSAYSFDVYIKCLQQIEISDLLHMCTLCSELPFGISTMIVASVYLNIKARFIKDSCTSIFVIQHYRRKFTNIELRITYTDWSQEEKIFGQFDVLPGTWSVLRKLIINWYIFDSVVQGSSLQLGG